MMVSEGFLYHADVVVKTTTGKQKIRGLKVNLPEEFDGIDLVAHKSLNPKKTANYTVSEVTTGLRVGIGRTKDEARENAIDKMTAYGIDKIRDLIKERGGR
jgi:hypothetical protein